MWTSLHELEKVHCTSNTQQERQPRHQIPIASFTNHESNVSIAAVHLQTVPQRRITSSTHGPEAIAGQTAVI